jgi:proline iminopeptidase
MCANPLSVPRAGYVPVDNAALFYREIGQGQPIIILHGGPDFDHRYLLPDMDRLSDSYRLIYYDQRGRGKSVVGAVQPEDINHHSEIQDLEDLRKYLQLDTVAVLGHSYGGVLAMFYAIQQPARVSHLILMNTAPASHEDLLLLRQELSKRFAIHADKLNALKSSPEYAAGDPDTVAEYYRLRFSTTIIQPEHLDILMRQMRLSFTNASVLQARVIEEHLYEETWYSEAYDLFPKLKQLNLPTLVIHGDNDFIPVECAVHVAQAVPGADFALLKDCGHFAYLEAPDEVRSALADFFKK